VSVRRALALHAVWLSRIDVRRVPE
jgi:hypothetical protein